MKASKKYTDVQISKEPRIFTGIKEFDKFFSNDGGMVLGTVILLTGSSGAGKTTFAAKLQKTLSSYKTFLYEREMSASAVKEQTQNLNIDSDNSLIADANSCPSFKTFLEEIQIEKPKIIFLDSLQVIAREDFPDMSEEDAIYEIIKITRKYAEEQGAVIFLIGHVTKEDVFRGTNTLMQLIDSHLEMIYNKKENVRTIAWGQKNRKGPMGMLYYELSRDEEGINFFTEEQFEMRGKTRNVLENIVKVIQVYLSNFNKKDKNEIEFIKECKSEIKKIQEKETDDLLRINKIISKVVELEDKYGVYNPV